jgi:1-phosphofructokinase
VISLGAEGAIFSNVESILKVSAPKIAVRTPVGAGDAMMAAIIYGHVQKWPLEKIAAWSVAAGSASAKQAGTATVSPEQIRALLDQVNVKTITH